VDTVDAVITLLISAAPIAELRGGIPFALARGAGAEAAFFLAIAGNLAVIPALLFGLAAGERLIRRSAAGERFVDFAFGRIRRRGRLIDRYGPIGLFLLVAVPLPGTGVWTAAIGAHLFGIGPRRAALPIALGVLVAGLLVLSGSLGLIRLFG